MIEESIKYLDKKYGKYKSGDVKPKTSQKLKDGDAVKVINGIHSGKSVVARDFNISKTGHLTITMLQKNGVRFKTPGKTLSQTNNNFK